jgi:hypothetical protein
MASSGYNGIESRCDSGFSSWNPPASETDSNLSDLNLIVLPYAQDWLQVLNPWWSGHLTIITKQKLSSNTKKQRLHYTESKVNSYFFLTNF